VREQKGAIENDFGVAIMSLSQVTCEIMMGCCAQRRQLQPLHSWQQATFASNTQVAPLGTGITARGSSEALATADAQRRHR
jgi:hypothetical protein